ncbi:SigE family RNA polymerase sigma factor [uncultured Nocardioides sp.]|uniref:SigE family RNA polymerase sigma factor n=1 Tax=uncultured Nocardioides sp. TaxID=198441 RepID=UPI00260B9E3C|nr:SigE family RNA polymerase sigma factor [uncultured Nocardioides sp.]
MGLTLRRGGRDKDAFTEFVRARSAVLRGTAYLLVGRRSLADDLVQEALVATYVAWPRLRDPRNAEAYARRVMATTVVSWSRRRSWHEQPTDEVPERVGGSAVDTLAERDAMWAAVQALPARQRAALVLRYYEDLTVAQTAAALDCAPGTVKSQVSAALANLRDHLGEEHPLLVDELGRRAGQAGVR